MSARHPPRAENIFLVGIFAAALVAHFYFATSNWTSAFMPGHEFRQAQTALISHYIDEQNNFSPFYETPVLGKPWVSILLEVPVYEWSVVGLSRISGLPHVLAARTVSLVCFYLILPALYLLLGRFQLGRPRRLLVLALVLMCPVYIFYSRAFLMESMELMCCAWFLLGFVRTMDERRWTWLALTVVAGTGAALIKSATFAVWLLPAAGYGVWLLGRDLREGRGWRVVMSTLLWGGGCVGVALGCLRWWLKVTDPIKDAHASAYLFTAKNLSQGNWGLFDFAAIFQLRTWAVLFERWQESILAPWMIGLVLVVGLAAFAGVRRATLTCAAVFFLAQLMFPFAYAYQDYYFYACAAFLLAAFGFVLVGVLDSRLPRWAGWLAVVLVFAAQVDNYWRGYHRVQVVKSAGGLPYTEALRDFTPRGSVLIIAGADWSAIIPLYAERKALMIRNGLETDVEYLNRAFDDLAGEKVSALVLMGEQRSNEALLKFTAERFGLETTPTFSHPAVDVYFARNRQDLTSSLSSGVRYDQVVFREQKPFEIASHRPFEISPDFGRAAFSNITPTPFQGYFTYGFGHETVGWKRVIVAHATSDLWLRPPAGATRITWDFGIRPDAYGRAGDRTDGVEFVITGELPSGESRLVFSRVLDPVNSALDRGVQHESVPYQPKPGEVLRFSSRPNVNPNFDWAYWAGIEVR